jgi:hypothetical protein
LDLAQGGASLSSGINMLYTRMFLKTLKPKCLRKLEQFPGLFDSNRLLEAKNLYEFDNVVTAPLHGYLDTDDYWHRASAKHVLNDITIPTLVLNAKNDPFLPGQYLPLKAAKCVQLDYPDRGGHVGFVSGKIPGQLDWLPQKSFTFLTRRHMDDIVKAAMAKWPDVPDCYGWLALDARGNWRMRDARCQALNLPGDIIRHPSLINFINRNYTVDERGCWFFQNGPQRVYVDLETTPYILLHGIQYADTRLTTFLTLKRHIVEAGTSVSIQIINLPCR